VSLEYFESGYDNSPNNAGHTATATESVSFDGPMALLTFRSRLASRRVFSPREVPVGILHHHGPFLDP